MRKVTCWLLEVVGWLVDGVAGNSSPNDRADGGLALVTVQTTFSSSTDSLVEYLTYIFGHWY